MKVKIIIKSLFIIFAAAFLFSCNQEDMVNGEISSNIENDQAVMDHIVLTNDIESQRSEDESREMGYYGTSSARETARERIQARFRGRFRPIGFYDCAERTVEQLENGKIITLDYDMGECSVTDKNYAGKIIDQISWSQNSRSHAISFENFGQEGITKNGTRNRTFTVVGMELDPEMGMDYDAWTGTLVEDITIDFPATEEEEALSETITTNFTLTGNGEGRYRSGQASYTNSNGADFSVKILEPLFFSRSCEDQVRFPLAGVEEVTTKEGVFTINYGDGSCDTLVEITKDGIITAVDLKDVIVYGKIGRRAIRKVRRGN
ncbi:hypothetical protein [Persicobacter psychrovividus]|uniref:Lipoprotein n=1 Tax=Persicobacter psychrovividus TaxID=387638 RepID=A0ABM7VJR2_9BACT|nr:hypothetical protein PEPS_35040 [Persicobacter psychrovividus]